MQGVGSYEFNSALRSTMRQVFRDSRSPRLGSESEMVTLPTFGGKQGEARMNCAGKAGNHQGHCGKILYKCGKCGKVGCWDKTCSNDNFGNSGRCALCGAVGQAKKT